MEYAATALLQIFRWARNYIFGIVSTPISRKCAFLTDVEGNYEYFERYIEISEVLEWADKDKTSLKFTDEDSHFVFGGDSQDKGPGDIRFVRILLDLKKKYGDRVHFIIGNRDANKLRLTTELGKEALDSPAVKTDTTFPYWIPSDKVVTPQKFVEKNKLENQDEGINRLLWILTETMGADGAFDRRKRELAILKEKKFEEIENKEVFQSYLSESDPNPKDGGDNFMLKYLEESELAYVFGRTVFVHGAITKTNKGSVPGQQTPEGEVKSWVEKLNAWKKQQIEDFKKNPYEGTNKSTRAGYGLMDYGVPNGNNKQTVIYDGNLVGGNAHSVDREVQQYLVKSEINTVLCGHVPHGDSPTIINSGPIRVITADTSYSKMGNPSPSGWGVDNRGIAVSEVVVWEDGRVYVHGILADGRKIDFKLGSPGLDTPVQGEDVFIGRELRDNFWVKAKLEGKESYIVCKGEGFKLMVEEKTAEQLLQIGFTDAKAPAPQCDMTTHLKTLSGADDFASTFDKLDPFVVLYLHNGDGEKMGDFEGLPTAFKSKDITDAGGSATFDETFKMVKPGIANMLRVELWDKNTHTSDQIQGWKDVNLDVVWDNGENRGKEINVEVHTVKPSSGHVCGDVAQYGELTGMIVLGITMQNPVYDLNPDLCSKRTVSLYKPPAAAPAAPAAAAAGGVKGDLGTGSAAPVPPVAAAVASAPAGGGGPAGGLMPELCSTRPVKSSPVAAAGAAGAAGGGGRT